MLIDTHAHIYHKRFGSDVHDVVKRAQEAGVDTIVMPAIDVPSIEAALELSEMYENLYVMSAIHPSDTKDATNEDFEQVVAFCAEDKVVAVGESGLDYYWDRSFDEKQHEYFRKHIRLAVDQDLPLILHNREADIDLVRILKEEKDASEHPERLRGIFHCYGGPAQLGQEAMELGFHLGVGGTSTFKNGGVDAALEGIDLSKLVLETDAPFLTPVPFRGKRNEPSYLTYVAERVAEIYQVTVDEVASTTTATAKKLFGI